MQNLKVIYIVSALTPKTPFLGKFVPGIQNCYFKLEFGT